MNSIKNLKFKTTTYKVPVVFNKVSLYLNKEVIKSQTVSENDILLECKNAVLTKIFCERLKKNKQKHPKKAVKKIEYHTLLGVKVKKTKNIRIYNNFISIRGSYLQTIDHINIKQIINQEVVCLQKQNINNDQELKTALMWNSLKFKYLAHLNFQYAKMSFINF